MISSAQNLRDDNILALRYQQHNNRDSYDYKEGNLIYVLTCINPTRIPDYTYRRDSTIDVDYFYIRDDVWEWLVGNQFEYKLTWISGSFREDQSYWKIELQDSNAALLFKLRYL